MPGKNCPYIQQAELFKVLAHPTRLAILNLLRNGEECVCHMEAYLGLRQAYISQHLMVLRDAGLIVDIRRGLNRYYSLTDVRVLCLIDDISEMLHGEPIIAQQTPHSNCCSCPTCIPPQTLIKLEEKSS